MNKLGSEKQERRERQKRKSQRGGGGEMFEYGKFWGLGLARFSSPDTSRTRTSLATDSPRQEYLNIDRTSVSFVQFELNR